jgi:hypothetical protein
VIENRLDFVRDTAFRDDSSKIRTDAARRTWPPCAASPSTDSAPPATSTSPPHSARQLSAPMGGP